MAFAANLADNARVPAWLPAVFARGEVAAGDIIENRPALSRRHPQFKEAFERYMAGS